MRTEIAGKSQLFIVNWVLDQRSMASKRQASAWVRKSVPGAWEICSSRLGNMFQAPGNNGPAGWNDCNSVGNRISDTDYVRIRARKSMYLFSFNLIDSDILFIILFYAGGRFRVARIANIVTCLVYGRERGIK